MQRPQVISVVILVVISVVTVVVTSVVISVVVTVVVTLVVFVVGHGDYGGGYLCDLDGGGMVIMVWYGSYPIPTNTKTFEKYLYNIIPMTNGSNHRLRKEWLAQ